MCYKNVDIKSSRLESQIKVLGRNKTKGFKQDMSHIPEGGKPWVCSSCCQSRDLSTSMAIWL